MRKRGETRHVVPYLKRILFLYTAAFLAALALTIPSAHGAWSLGTYGTCDYDTMPADGCWNLVSPSSCMPPNAWPEGNDCSYATGSGTPGDCAGGWHCIPGYWAYRDNDNDGWAVSTNPHVTVQEGYLPPAGYSEAVGDCNDGNYNVHPGAYDTCGDGLDQDCSGSDRVCCTETFQNSPGWGGNVGCTGIWVSVSGNDASKGCDSGVLDKHAGNWCASCDPGYRFFAINNPLILFSAQKQGTGADLPTAESFSPLDHPVLKDLLSEVSLRPPLSNYYTACYPTYSTRGYTCYDPIGIPADPQRVQHRNIEGSWDYDTNSWLCGAEPDNTGCNNYFCWYNPTWSALNGAYSCNNGGSISGGYCKIGQGGVCSTSNNCLSGWCSTGRCCPNGQAWNGASCSSPATCNCPYSPITSANYLNSACVDRNNRQSCLSYTNSYYGPGQWWYTYPYTPVYI